jgi:hypothetical protein
VPVAHPLSGSPPLPVPPALLVAVTVLLAALVATRLRALSAAPPGGAGRRWGPVPYAGAAVLLAALAGIARWGPPAEPDNLAAVGSVNLLWPAVFLVAAARRRDGSPGPAVWPAAVAAAAWAGFLVASAVRVAPRTLAVWLAAYGVVTVAGCVAVGRDRWLRSAEVFGLLAGWSGTRLTGWRPPAGAAAVLGAVYGGTVFARVRLTGLWGDVAVSPDARRWTWVAGAAAIGGGALLSSGLARWAVRRDAAGSVEAALLPVVAAAVVATLLRRALVAAQLLPQLAGLGGPRAVDLNPGGTGTQQLLAWLVVTTGSVAGAVVLARRVPGVRRRDPGLVTLCLSGALAALAVTAR